MAEGLDVELQSIDPIIVCMANEAERGGSYELEEGIRIFEARADAIIAAQRAAKAKQERVDKSA